MVVDVLPLMVSLELQTEHSTVQTGSLARPWEAQGLSRVTAWAQAGARVNPALSPQCGDTGWTQATSGL